MATAIKRYLMPQHDFDQDDYDYPDLPRPKGDSNAVWVSANIEDSGLSELIFEDLTSVGEASYPAWHLKVSNKEENITVVVGYTPETREQPSDPIEEDVYCGIVEVDLGEHLFTFVETVKALEGLENNPKDIQEITGLLEKQFQPAIATMITQIIQKIDENLDLSLSNASFEHNNPHKTEVILNADEVDVGRVRVTFSLEDYIYITIGRFGTQDELPIGTLVFLNGGGIDVIPG